ncbi:MAG: GMC family oxidoreductase [Pseudomonadota bacterium]
MDDVSGLDLTKYSTIIVGSGPAGATLSRFLEARGEACLILETGTEQYDDKIQRSFSTVDCRGHYGNGHWNTHWVRALGGTSMIWGGWCQTLDQRDFADWPISADALKPHYQVAAKALGRDDIITTYREPHATGFVFKPFSLTYTPTRFGEVQTDILKSGGKIDIALSTSVCGLVPNASRSRVDAIKLSQNGGPPVTLQLSQNQRLILAAGAMGNTQLMLTPPEGETIGVGNESDMVGRCLMEHPHIAGVAKIVAKAGQIGIPQPPKTFGEYMPALIPNDEVYEAAGGLGVTLSLVDEQRNYEDPTERFLLAQYGADAELYSIYLRAEMSPETHNRVELTYGEDPSGLPRLKAMCAVSTTNHIVYRNVLERLGEQLIETGIGRLAINNETLFRTVHGGGHTMGTTRMGNDPKSSVVDANCRVHGYGNLFVAGSSVFTTGGASNPTMTIVALASRLADFLTETV